MTIDRHIEIVWRIKDIPHYGFGSDKKLYNLKTCRELKQCMNCQSIGYWFGKKFMTLTALRKLLYRSKKKNILMEL